jgi:hypothetical protein
VKAWFDQYIAFSNQSAKPAKAKPLEPVGVIRGRLRAKTPSLELQHFDILVCNPMLINQRHMKSKPHPMPFQPKPNSPSFHLENSSHWLSDSPKKAGTNRTPVATNVSMTSLIHN